MSSQLMDLQEAFLNAVLHKEIHSDVFAAVPRLGVRFEIYRQNFMQGYCNALRKTYGQTCKLIGDDAFTQTAVRYVCTHLPDKHQVFATYGSNFFSFLENTAAKELARLEWLLQVVLMAPYDVGGAAISGDTPKWQLRSDVRLLKSDIDVLSLYKELSQGQSDVIKHQTSWYVMYRAQETPVIKSIGDLEFQIFELLQRPHTADELFHQLTISQDSFVKILSKIMTPNFVRISNESNSSVSEGCYTL